MIARRALLGGLLAWPGAALAASRQVVREVSHPRKRDWPLEPYGPRKPDMHRVVATPAGLRALVRTFRGEGEGEPALFMFGLVHVVCNRIASADPRFAADTSIEAACARHGQFLGYQHQPPLPVGPHSGPLYEEVLLMATGAAVRQWQGGGDITGGAQMFALATCRPPWTRDAALTTRIGHHDFWRLRARVPA